MVKRCQSFGTRLLFHPIERALTSALFSILSNHDYSKERQTLNHHLFERTIIYNLYMIDLSTKVQYVLIIAGHESNLHSSVYAHPKWPIPPGMKREEWKIDYK